MTSTLFKPVYVTPAMSATRKFDVQQSNLINNADVSSLPTPQLCFAFDRLANAEHDECRSSPLYPTHSSALLPAFVPKFISTKVIKLKPSKGVPRGAFNETENVYIARPYRQLMALHYCESSPTIPRFPSSSIDESFETDSIYTHPTLQMGLLGNRPNDNLIECSSGSQVPASSRNAEDILLQKSCDGKQSKYRVFKSASEHCLSVPHSNEMNKNKTDSSMETKTTLLFNGSSSSPFSPDVQSFSFLHPSLHESFSHSDGDPTTLVSLTQSFDHIQLIKSNQKPSHGSDSSRSVSVFTSNSQTVPRRAIIPIPRSFFTRDHVSDTTEAELFAAQDIKNKDPVPPREFEHEVPYPKAHNVHCWLPASHSGSRLVCSVLCAAQSIAGIFPVSFIEYRQIHDIHAKFAVAKVSLSVGSSLNSTLVSKPSTFLGAHCSYKLGIDEHSPISPVFFFVESNFTVGDIKILNHHRRRLTCESKVLYRLSKDNIKYTKEHFAAICSAHAWSSSSSAVTVPQSQTFKFYTNEGVDQSLNSFLESSSGYKKRELMSSDAGKENNILPTQNLLRKTTTPSPTNGSSCNIVGMVSNTFCVDWNTFGPGFKDCSKSKSCIDQEPIKTSKGNIPSKGTVYKSVTMNSDLDYSHQDSWSRELNCGPPPSNIMTTLPKTQLNFRTAVCMTGNMDDEHSNYVPKCDSREQDTGADSPVIDVKIVPKVPSHDEPAKLNVIKGTTSYRQLINFISTGTPGERNPRPKSVMSERSMASMKKSTFPQTGIFTNIDDYESIASSTLIPEGHPAGWDAEDDKNAIYLSWTSVQKTPGNKPMKQLFESDLPSGSEKVNCSSQCVRKLSDQRPERDNPTTCSKMVVPTPGSDVDPNSQTSKVSLNRTTLEEGTRGLTNEPAPSSCISHKNTVTWASEITQTSGVDEGEVKICKGGKRIQQALNEGEVEEEVETDVAANVVELLKGSGSLIPNSLVFKKGKAKGEDFPWKCESDTKENEAFEAEMNTLTEQDLHGRRVDVTSVNQGLSSLASTTGRRSCLVSSKPGEVTAEAAFLMRNGCRSFRINNVSTLREEELQTLMEKCRDLRRELKKRSLYKSDVDKNGAFELSSSTTTSTTESACVSTSHRQSSDHFGMHSLPKNCGHIKGYTLRNGKELSKCKSWIQQRRRRHGSHKGDHASSASRDVSNQSRSCKYGHWLPISQYAGYPPPPQPYPSYAYPSYTYYPPPPPPLPPPALPHSNYMAPPPVLIDPWTFQHCHASRQYRRRRSRKPSKHHQRSAARKHKLRKAMKHCKESEISLNQCQERKRLHNEDSTLSMRTSKAFSGPPVAACYQVASNAPISHPPQIATSTVSDTSMQPPRSSLLRPLSPLHQSNNAPRGIYALPEAGGHSFNPFKGHSLPNEPSGLIETRLTTVSPPTKIDPSPSAAFSGAVYGASKIHSIPDNQPRSTPSAPMPLCSAPTPKTPGDQSQTVQEASRPPNRRIVYQNAPPRQLLSDIMASSPGAPSPCCVPSRVPASTPGAKVDGPQVTSTGDKYGLFRIPTSEAEYSSCEKRFDWLQSEKTHLENSLNKLTMESASGWKQSLGFKPSVEESRIANALNQIGREMSALRLVMKKYASERKKGLLLKTTTF